MAISVFRLSPRDYYLHVMKNALTALFLVLSIAFSEAQLFNGKPQYDVLVRQYPDTFGTFRMELFPTIAPLHCHNFDTLAQQGFYDSLAFHRVVPNFVIQGGDPNSKTGPPSTWGFGDSTQQQVPAEFTPLSHDRSILGAARGNDINSATSQFYINTANNTGLNGNYTAYGKVISGMNVVDSVEGVPASNELPLNKVDMFITYVGEDTTSPSQAPSLVAPADGSTDLFGNISFSWSAVSANDFLMYYVEFSKQSDFSTIDYSRHVLRGQTSITPLSNLEQGYVTYYWRVSTNNGGKLTTSAVRSFTTFIAPPMPILPADGATNTFTNPQFQWSNIAAADSFNLVVSNIPAFIVPAQNVIDIHTQDTAFFAPALSDNKTYYWIVRSLTGGVQGGDSELRSFTTGNVLDISIESTSQSVRIYPNPNSGSLYVDFNSDKEAILKLFDVNGKVLKSVSIQPGNNLVDCSDYRGIILYQLETANTTERGRIIITE